MLMNEKIYQVTMHLAKKLLDDGVISEKTFQEFKSQMIEKYSPLFT